jgi:hypothetical protein
MSSFIVSLAQILHSISWSLGEMKSKNYQLSVDGVAGLPLVLLLLLPLPDLLLCKQELSQNGPDKISPIKQRRSMEISSVSHRKVDKLSLFKAEELSPAATAEEFSLIEPVPKKEAESSTSKKTGFGVTEEKELNPVVQEQLCWIILYTHSHIQ